MPIDKNYNSHCCNKANWPVIFPKNSDKGLKACFAQYIFLRQFFYGGSVLRRGHSGEMLELPGEIVDRGISQLIGDLGKIKLPVPDELLGGINFHTVKIFNDAGVPLFRKKLF